jgi:hypothetical protein
VPPTSGPSSPRSLILSRWVVGVVCGFLLAFSILATMRSLDSREGGIGTAPPVPTPSASSAAPEPTRLPSRSVTASGDTGTPASPTVTSTTLDLSAVAEDRLDQGLIAYNPPGTATQGEEFQVTVRLQRGVSVTSSALPKVPGPGTATIEQLPVGAYMTASLGGAGFDVRAITPSRLPLAPDEIAEFAWVVGPRAVGALTLTLTLVAEVQGQPARERSYSRQIHVTVLPDPSPWSRLASWSGWTDVIAGILVAAVVALVTWLLARLRRRRREADAQRSVAVEPAAPALPSKETVASGEAEPKASSEAVSPDGSGSPPPPQ